MVLPGSTSYMSSTMVSSSKNPLPPPPPPSLIIYSSSNSISRPKAAAASTSVPHSVYMTLASITSAILLSPISTFLSVVSPIPLTSSTYCVALLDNIPSTQSSSLTPPYLPCCPILRIDPSIPASRLTQIWSLLHAVLTCSPSDLRTSLSRSR